MIISKHGCRIKPPKQKMSQLKTPEHVIQV